MAIRAMEPPPMAKPSHFLLTALVSSKNVLVPDFSVAVSDLSETVSPRPATLLSGSPAVLLTQSPRRSMAC